MRTDSGLSMKITRSYSWLKFLLIVFGAFIFSVKPSHEEFMNVKSLNPIKIQLNWRHQFEFAAFYAAIEKRYYQDAGLDVQLIEGGPGVDVIDDVAKRRVHYGVGNSSLIVAHKQGQPVVALAALMQHSAFALLARRDHGISVVSDLDDKVVSCAPHACPEVIAYLKSFGLADGRVNYVPLRSTSFEENFVYSDATDIFVTNQGFDILGREDQFVLMMPRSSGIDLYGDVLFTSSDQLDEFPEQVEAFRAATLKGLEYAMSHQDELIDVILTRYNTQNKSRDKLIYEARKLYDLTRLDLVEPGYMSLGRWQHVRDIYANIKMLPDNYPVNDFIYNKNSKSWPIWALWAVLGLGMALLISSGILVYLKGLNFNLRLEIDRRSKAEMTLKASQDSFLYFIDQANNLVTHEVRTPVSVLQAQLSIIEVKLGYDHGIKKNIEAMRTAITRIIKLFDKNLAKIFSTTSCESRVNVVEIDQAIKNVLSSECKMFSTSIIHYQGCNAMLYVNIDSQMFVTAMVNILENAIKYSVPGGHIDLSVNEHSGIILIEVVNISKIISSNKLDRLTDKGVRGDNIQGVPGTGIGLHLVRLIVETHGGSVNILTLPLDAEDEYRFILQLRLPLVTQRNLTFKEGM